MPCPKGIHNVEPGGHCECELRIRLGAWPGPDGKGVLSYVLGDKFPMNGLFDSRFLRDASITKRLGISSLKLITTFPFYLCIPLFLVFPRSVKRAIALWYFEIVAVIYTGSGTNGFYLPNQYSHSTRELLRTLSITFSVPELRTPDISLDNEVRFVIVNSATMAWENDAAYRYRGQDVFSLIETAAIEKNPRKELLRVLRIGAERECLPTLGSKWKLMEYLCSVLLLFPSVRRHVRTFFREVDLREMIFDGSDSYWCYERYDYNFGGETYKERMVKKRELDATLPEAKPPVQLEEPALEIRPNQTFWTLTREEKIHGVAYAASEFVKSLKDIPEPPPRHGTKEK